MENYEIIVLGGGPAGITLSKQLGKKKRMAVVRSEDYSLIYCAMPYVIEGLLEREKTYKSDALVVDFGAELIRGNAVNVNLEEKTVTMDDGRIMGFEELIVATGAIPFIPPVPGRELKGVTGFKTQRDLEWIEKLVDDGLANAVIVGAGAIGIELAQALNYRGVSVDLVDMGATVLPNLVDCDMSSPLADELIEQGINLHLNARVTELLGEGMVDTVVLGEDARISFPEKNDGSLPGLVVFAAGMKPELSLFGESDLAIGQDGILVNDKMETNVPGVYAVGDVCQFNSGITGDRMPGKLATNAVPMAKVLGMNLKGGNRRYPGFYNGSATKVGKYFVGGTGLSETLARKLGYDIAVGYSTSTTKFPIMPDARPKKVKLISDRKTHRLLGAQMVSEEPVVTRIDLFTFAIQKETTVEEMSQLSYASQPHQSFYPAANVVVLAAEDIRARENW